MPARRVVIEFQFLQPPNPDARYRLIVAPEIPVDLCSIDPGHEVDLLLVADLRAMTAAWMGMSEFSAELRARRITLAGDRALSDSFTRWIGRSGLATAATDTHATSPEQPVLPC